MSIKTFAFIKKTRKNCINSTMKSSVDLFLTLCILGNFACFLDFFFKLIFFFKKKNLSGIPSEC